MLIADGHHRYSISRTYRDDVRAATGDRATPAEQTLAFVSELVAEQLSVDAIHRLYADITPAELGAALARSFTLTDGSTRAADVGRHAVAKVSWSWSARRGLAAGPARGRFDGVALDGAWLETALADVPLTVTYQHGLSEAGRGRRRPLRRGGADPSRSAWPRSKKREGRRNPNQGRRGGKRKNLEKEEGRGGGGGGRGEGRGGGEEGGGRGDGGRRKGGGEEARGPRKAGNLKEGERGGSGKKEVREVEWRGRCG